MTTDETITEKLPAVRDGHTGELAIIPPEADDAWLASLRDSDPVPDLAAASYPDQVVAALHGNPDVFTLDEFTQYAIGGACRTFELFARGIRNGWPAETIAKRGSVLLMADPNAGTPMRCGCRGCGREATVTSSEPPGWKLSRAHTGPCDGIHLPLTGGINWEVAGRADVMCPPCWAAQPKHAVKAAPVKAKTATTRRRRTSTARSKAVNGSAPPAPPDAAA